MATQPPPTPQAGMRLGPYVLESVLGEGSMGIVFQASHDNGAIVALKVLRPALSGNEVYRRRFEREGRIASGLSHRHLVEVVDTGEAEGWTYLASRYVAGESLADRLDRDGPLAVENVVQIAGEVGTALDMLHASDLVHRDVKPSNVMLADTGAELTDFGVARAIADSVLTAPGRVVGTVDYLAPEVIRGEQAEPPADVYSLGCLLYECVTGTPPFGSLPFAEAAVAHVSVEPADPSPTRDDLPRQFWMALRHGLAKDPADRPPTATAYALMLRVSARTS